MSEFVLFVYLFGSVLSLGMAVGAAVVLKGNNKYPTSVFIFCFFMSWFAVGIMLGAILQGVSEKYLNLSGD